VAGKAGVDAEHAGDTELDAPLPGRGDEIGHARHLEPRHHVQALEAFSVLFLLLFLIFKISGNNPGVVPSGRRRTG